MSEIHSKISLHRFSLFPSSIAKNHLIADDFYPLASPVCNYTRGTTLTLFWKGGRSKSWKLDTYKQEEDFKPGFEEKIRFFRFFKNIYLKCDNCLILRISFATQLSTNLLFAWNQFSVFNEQLNRYVFRYKSMKSEKKNKQNRLTKRACHRSLPIVIDRYNRYQSNPIYRFLSIDYCGYTTMCCTQTYNHFTTTTFSVFWW